MLNNIYTVLSLRLLTEQHDALRKIGFERRIAVAELVRQAVQEWLERENKVEAVSSTPGGERRRRNENETILVQH
jgi:hypothetical protein